jgi:hypothetical protein
MGVREPEWVGTAENPIASAATINMPLGHVALARSASCFRPVATRFVLRNTPTAGRGPARINAEGHRTASGLCGHLVWCGCHLRQPTLHHKSSTQSTELHLYILDFADV